MLKTKINTILLCTLFTLFFPLSAGAQYRNPILYADVPDMSVCRAGDYFYMVSTTMHLMPGAPIMRSPDMKHCKLSATYFLALTMVLVMICSKALLTGKDNGHHLSAIMTVNSMYGLQPMVRPDVGLSILRQNRPVHGNFFRAPRISMTVRFCLMMTGGCISFTVRDSLRS